jgi:serine protease AprX
MEAESRAPAAISREHVDRFLRRERQDLERLAEAIGSEPARKLDRRLARDLVHERRERAAAAIFGKATEETQAPRHRVMATMHSARWREARVASGKDRSRRRVIGRMQRSGRRAVARLEEALADRPVEILETFWLTHSVSVAAPAAEVVELASRGDVDNVTAVKPQFALALEASRPLIQADQVANSLGFDGNGVTVGVLDTGVDVGHAALSGVVTNQQDFTGLNAAGTPAEGIGDMVGHGTHVAGIVASQNEARRGIAPGATIEDLKVLDAAGVADQNCMIGGLTAAVNAGLDVASCSWGFSHGLHGWLDPPAEGQQDGTCVLCVAVDNAVAAGVTVVVAAGNEDNDSCRTYDTHIRCPGIAREAITVAASTDADEMADFSSIGPTPEGRAKPDVTAPGREIASCRAAGTSMGEPIDADWTNSDGTSMACPHVSGVVALMLEKNAALTPAQIKGILMSTAVNIGATANEMGAGRVDALAAVNAS